MEEVQFSRPKREEDERKLMNIISNFEGVTSCVIVKKKQKIVPFGSFNVRKLWEKIHDEFKYNGEVEMGFEIVYDLQKLFDKFEKIGQVHFRRPKREEDERKLIDIISNFEGVRICFIVTCDPQKIVATGSFSVRKLWEKILEDYDGETLKFFDKVPRSEESEIIQKSDIQKLTQKLENFEMVQEEDVTKEG